MKTNHTCQEGGCHRECVKDQMAEIILLMVSGCGGPRKWAGANRQSNQLSRQPHGPYPLMGAEQCR